MSVMYLRTAHKNWGRYDFDFWRQCQRWIKEFYEPGCIGGSTDKHMQRFTQLTTNDEIRQWIDEARDHSTS